MSVRNLSLFFCLLFSILSTPLIAEEEKFLAPYKNETEINEENFPFFPSRLDLDGGEEGSHVSFDSTQTCASCHTDIYKEWEQSAMAHAWKDPFYKALLKRASDATKGEIDNFCTGCHTPIGTTTMNVTAHDDRENIPGVDCESCHNISNRTGLDNGAFVLSKTTKDGRPVKFGPRSDAESPYHATQYSELHTRSDFCAVCHNVTHPFNGTAVERTYDEWLESAYSEEGVDCQDCHMTPGPGMAKRAGKPAIMGKDRSDVASHFFAGANVPLARIFGNEEMAQRNIAMLRSAAKLELVDLTGKIEANELVTLTYKVTNSGAGHKLPTGFPEGREMWLNVSILDDNKRQIYSSGHIEKGKTAPGTTSFKVYMADANGDIVDINVWEVATVVSDTRILPKGHAYAKYTFKLPEDFKGGIHTTAELKYWPFSQAMVDELLGEDGFKVDIVTMAEVEHESCEGCANLVKIPKELKLSKK